MPNPSQADTTNVDKSRPPQDDGPNSSATISIAHAGQPVKRIVERHNAGGGAGQRRERGQNYDAVRELVAERVRKTEGRISASCCQVLYCRWRGTPSISGDACRDSIAQNAYRRWRWQRGISRRGR